MKKHAETAVIVWGNQLSLKNNSALQHDATAPVIIIESKSICNKYKYHKQKITFVLTAMRDFADALRAEGRTVIYRNIDESSDEFFKELLSVCKKYSVKNLLVMQASDRAPQTKLETWCKKNKILLTTTENTLFLTSTTEFNAWAKDQKHLKMETFYRWQRQRLNILMENDKPVGGKWNYDAENRKPLPKNIDIPKIDFPKPSKNRDAVLKIINKYFAGNPGDNSINWLPTTEKQAQAWLDDFIKNRLPNFGDYEDAMKHDEVFLFHSALSPLLNIGLLHPEDIVNKVEQANIPLASKEGFIRQVIGWREFMFGLYHYYPANWKESNFFGNSKKLPSEWWQLNDDKFDETPVKHVIARLNEYGYSHHIERLMVLGNYMLLNDYDPAEVFNWFMCMYVDAYEWVMVPNVIGMSQFADGGIDKSGFATKPYISGANYLQKMGKWWSGKDIENSQWTKLYWRFLSNHRQKLQSNYRLAPLFKNKNIKK